jgi:hypothetical protein
MPIEDRGFRGKALEFSGRKGRRDSVCTVERSCLDLVCSAYAGVGGCTCDAGGCGRW